MLAELIGLCFFKYLLEIHTEIFIDEIIHLVFASNNMGVMEEQVGRNKDEGILAMR